MTEITKFSLLKRRVEISPENYSAHWHGTHARVLVTSGHSDYNADYVQNHFSSLSGDRTVQLFDGAAQMRQRSENMVRAGFQEDPRYMEFVRPDEELFLDVAKSVVLFTQAEQLRGPSVEPHKLMIFGAWAEETESASRESELVAWEHQILQAAFAGALTSCVHYYVIEGAMRGLTTTDFDERNKPVQRFDVVVEYRSVNAKVRRTLGDLLGSHWPGTIERSTAFVTLSDEKRIY